MLFRTLFVLPLFTLILSAQAFAVDEISGAGDNFFSALANVSGQGGDVSGGTGGDISGGAGSSVTEASLVSHGYRSQSAEQLYSLQRKAIGVTDPSLTGEGIGIAILDSGISANSSARENLTVFRDFVDEHNTQPTDGCGHGTFISSIILKTAPKASLIVGRVLNSVNKGSAQTLIRGLKWVKANRRPYNIRILNLSLVGNATATGEWNEGDQIRKLIHELMNENVLVLVAAGNDASANLDTAPSNSPDALTVGSVDHDFGADYTQYQLSSFSNFGYSQSIVTQNHGFLFLRSVERSFEELTLKPDVLAPGAFIAGEIEAGSRMAAIYTALQALAQTGSSQEIAVRLNTLVRIFPDDQLLRLLVQVRPDIAMSKLRSSSIRRIDDHTGLLFGTSFATPLVSAGAALVLARYPQISALELKQMMIAYPTHRLTRTRGLTGNVPIFHVQEILGRIAR